MATRKKTPATTAHIGLVPQGREQAAQRVRELGDIQRRLQARIHQLDTAIAELQAAAAPDILELNGQVEAHHLAIQTWAEGNRAVLTNGHRVKTVNLLTGEIGWRQRPPSVSLTNVEATVGELIKLGLRGFVRQKQEVNKDAILATHALASSLKPDDVGDAAERVRLDLMGLSSIKGIKVVSGLEDFFVAPTETVLDEVSQ